MKSILNRLKDLRDNNKDIAALLEKKFPEIQEPFIKNGQLFMREQYRHNIYRIGVNYSGNFQIINIKDGKDWNHSIRPSNPNTHDRRDYFLTRGDLITLMKKSGCSIDSVAFLSLEDIGEIHRKAFGLPPGCDMVNRVE